MHKDIVLGVDIGGSGIKGALVDTRTGALLSDRLRLVTPQPATPEAMAKTFAEVVRLHEWQGPIGCGFPAVIKNGVALTASNIDDTWQDRSVQSLLTRACGQPVNVLNDADAAGLAEMHYGAGVNTMGTVLLITIGTGLGSALFRDGHLVPNTELGHLFLHGGIAEDYASNRIRKEENLDWEVWGRRFHEYLQHLNLLLAPDLIILGGGVSKHFDTFSPYFQVETRVLPAKLENNAGIVGAACFAHELIS